MERYYEIAVFCTVLINSATQISEAERQMLGGWNTLLKLFQMPSVHAAAVPSFDQVADFLESVVDDALVPSANQDDEDLNAQNRVGGLLRGLARRAASDCRAIDLLQENGHERQAAGLCRSLYETFGWMDLLLDEDGGENAAILYEFLHDEAVAQARIPVVRNLLATIDVVRSALLDEPIVPILPSVLLEEYRAYERAVEAEVDRLRRAVPPGVRGRRQRLPNCYLKVAEYYEAVQVRRYATLWSTAIYHPSCRILHGADAMDYVDIYQRGGVAADVVPDGLPSAIGSAKGILAATAFRAVLLLPAFHEWMRGFYWEGNGEEEEHRVADRGIVFLMEKWAQNLLEFAGPILDD